jgi:hypothetical protein
MALDYDNLSALTKDKYIPLLVDNVFKTNILTHRLLRKSKAAASGNKVLQPLEYGKAAAKGFYSGYDVMDTSPTEVFTDAVYNWKQAYVTISISGKEEAINSGPERVIDLLEAKVKNAEKSIKDLFGDQLYGTQGDSDSGFIGLKHIIASPSDSSAETAVGGKLGGISRMSTANSGYEWWRGNVATADSDVFNTLAGSGDNSIQREMREMYGKCSVGSDQPTLIITDQINFDCYEESLSGQKRFGPSSSALADAGFQALKYRGADVVVDDKCPAGEMYFLNEKYIGFRHHSKRNFAFEGFQKPVNQDARIAKILWLGALTVSNPSMLGRISGLATGY